MNLSTFLPGKYFHERNIDNCLAQGHAPGNWAQHRQKCCVWSSPLSARLLS
nr:MAG TPA: hypothetical protein [Caudoviricetes sp.]